jgi:hypothetical protein
MTKNHVALILAVVALLVAALGLFGVGAGGGAAAIILVCVAVIVLAA